MIATLISIPLGVFVIYAFFVFTYPEAQNGLVTLRQELVTRYGQGAFYSYIHSKQRYAAVIATVISTVLFIPLYILKFVIMETGDLGELCERRYTFITMSSLTGLLAVALGNLAFWTHKTHL